MGIDSAFFIFYYFNLFRLISVNKCNDSYLCIIHHIILNTFLFSLCFCSEAGMSPTALSDNGGTTINEILHETAKYE